MNMKKHTTVGVMELLIIAGFAALYAWYFMIVIGFPAFFPVEGPELTRRLIQLACLVGLVIGSFGTLRRPKSFEKQAYSRFKTVLWGLVSCSMPVLIILDAIGAYVHPVLAGTCGVASGLAAGYFFVGWENLSAYGRLRDTLSSVGIAMAAGCGLFALIFIGMTAVMQGAMTIVMVLFSTGAYYAVSIRRFPKNKAKAKKEISKGQEALKDPDFGIDEKSMRHSFNLRLSALFFIVNVPLGFALPIIYLVVGQSFVFVLCFCLAVLIVFVAGAHIVKKDISFIALLRSTVIVCTLTLIAFAVIPDVSLYCLAVLMATWFILRLAHCGTLIRLTSVQRQMYPAFLTARAKLPGYLGFVAGFGIALAFSGAGIAMLSTVGLGIVALLVTGSLVLLPFSANYSKQLEAVPALVVSSSMSGEGVERAKCAELAVRYNLSPREEEVLFYIVKGRNARYIADKLVISESTAKTHIHNIYKKSGIHSQQRFIGMMDEAM